MPQERRKKNAKPLKAAQTKLSLQEQEEIDKAVDKVFEDYGETLRRLGKE